MSIESQYSIPFYNDSGEAVPPFAIMQPKGLSNSGGRWFISIEKPQSDTFGPTWLVNGPSQVASGKTGSAADPSLAPVWIARDTGTVTFGDGWGVDDGSWKLKIKYPGQFMAYGDSPSTDVRRGLFQCPKFPLLIGNMTSAYTSSAADVELRTDDGSNTGITLQDVPGCEGVFQSGDEFDSGTKVILAWMGHWQIIAFNDCPTA